MTEEAASALEPGSPFWAPLKAGWVRELVYRASIGQGNTKADAYYKAPKHAGGKKYRSLKEMERAIEEGKPGFEGLSLANFSFRRDPLKVNDPSMELIRGADPSAKIPNKRHSDVAESPPAKKPKKGSPMTGVLPKQAPLPTVRPPWPLLPTVAPPRPLLPTVAPPRPLLPKMVPRPALSGHPQTAIRSRLVFPTIVPKPTQAGARPMGFAGGIRPVPANFLKGKVQTAKPTEEIVCEPAIYGIGKFPANDTAPTSLQATNITSPPASTRVYQIVSSKRLAVPFTVPPQDLELDGIATIAPSEDNTFVEGKSHSSAPSEDNTFVEGKPHPSAPSGSGYDPSISSEPKESPPQTPERSQESPEPAAPQKRLDVNKLRNFLASRMKKISSKPSSDVGYDSPVQSNTSSVPSPEPSRPPKNRRKSGYMDGPDSDYRPDGASDSDQSDSDPKPKGSGRARKSRKSRTSSRVYTDSESDASVQCSNDSQSQSKTSDVSEGPGNHKSDGQKPDDSRDSASSRSVSEDRKLKLEGRMSRKFILESDQSSSDLKVAKPRKRKISSVYSSSPEPSDSDSERNNNNPPSIAPNIRESTNPPPNSDPIGANSSLPSDDFPKIRSSEREMKVSSPRRSRSSSSSISSSDSEHSD